MVSVVTGGDDNTDTVDTLLARLDSLANQLLACKQTLDSISEKITENEEVPPGFVAAQIIELNNTLETILNDAEQLARMSKLEFIGIRSIRELRKWLESSCTRVTADGLNRARNILNFVVKLRHKQNQSVRGLDECSRLAADLLAQLDRKVDIEIEEIIAGQHVLALLVYLIQNAAVLTESETETLFQRISERFGAQVALAASRGTLTSDYEYGKSEQHVTTKMTAGDEPTIDLVDVAFSSPSAIAPTDIRVSQNRHTGAEDLISQIAHRVVTQQPQSPSATECLIGSSQKAKLPSVLGPRVCNGTASSFGLQRIESKELFVRKKSCPHCRDQQETSSKVHNECGGLKSISTTNTDCLANDVSGAGGVEHAVFEPGEPILSVSASSANQIESADAIEIVSQEQPRIAVHAKVSAHATLSSLAGQLLQSDSPRDCENLALFLISKNLPSLAFQVGSYFELSHEDATLRDVPLSLLRAVVLGRFIKGEQDNSEIARVLANDIISNSLINGPATDENTSQVVSLLKISAYLKPALLAPSTSASEILRSARIEGLPHLAEYVRIVSDFSERGWALEPHAFVFMKSKTQLDKEARELAKEVQNWLLKAPQAEMIYGGTKKVWLHWLKPHELIWELFEPIRTGDTSAIERVKEIASKLQTPADIEREVHTTERSISTTARDKTRGKALHKLQAVVSHALRFVDDWIRLCSIRSTVSNEFTREHAENIRAGLSKLHQSVILELSDAVNDCEYPDLKGGLTQVWKTVSSIDSLFSDESYVQIAEPSVAQLERGDLLLIPGFRLGQSWDIACPPEAMTAYETIISYLRSHDPDMTASFHERIQQDDYVGANHTLQLLRSNGHIEEANKFARTIEQTINEARARLERDIELTRNVVEEAVGLGLLRESERAGYIGQIAALERIIENVLNFPDHHELLLFIRNQVEKKKGEAIDIVRKRLDSVKTTDKDRERIDEVLHTGDVLTANEYIDVLLREQTLPEPTLIRDPFSDFFPEKSAKIEAFLEEPRARHEVIRLVRERENVCGLDFKKPLGTQTNWAAQMLEAWFKAKETKTVDRGVLETILQHLGFKVRSTTKTRFTHNRGWFDLVTEPIRNRDLCPVSQFGSGTDGNYRILCVWDRPNEEDLLNEVGETVHGSPVIVFFFGCLSLNRRRLMAKLSRERRRTFIIVDDSLMVYLCGETGTRLPTLLKCTLPFTFLEPYVTTAGLVPPEIFYGRRQERDSIISQLGSCFIYGGRQLGKTALLRQVERDFHQPTKGQIALWIDLKAEGIGYQRSADDLATVIANELKSRGLLKLPSNQVIQLDKLLSNIRAWLAEDPTRRMLLLLDEADRFLESDARVENGEGFRRTAKLKYLMDATQRRFKVVFAGLHNVQRMTRLANHPLAHYGEPICIGPLLNGAEWRAARELIKEPLRTIGYEIAEDLVTRIMSQTNYYPSLIQLYCQEMLRHVVQKQNLAKFDASTVPPYVFSDDFVRDAYLSQNLRKAIRDRFIWTLQLDRRYEVIAYSIAYSTLANDWEQAEQGYSVTWVQEEVMTWWTEGFKGKSRDEIKVLLEEMVGLGILRDTPNGKFALRSPNVVMLMGAEEEIVEALLTEREPPIEYEPNTFRAALRKGTNKVDMARRSPFTALQEADLIDQRNWLSVILGTESAGIDDVSLFVKPEFTYSLELSESLDRGAFNRQLADGDFSRKDGTGIILVPPTVPWTIEWFNDAELHLKRLRHKEISLKICFIGDPAVSWQIAREVPLQELIEKWHLVTLRPWDDAALRQWLEDCQYIDADKNQRELITATTGNWPKLLYQFNANKGRGASWKQRIKEMDQDLIRNRDRYLEMFGLHGSNSVRRQILTNLSIVGEASINDLTQLDSVGESDVKATLVWAELLHLCTQTNKGTWQPDQLVAKLLTES